MYGENKLDEINVCIKNLFKDVEKKYNSFIKDMDKEAKRIENEISLDLTGDFILFIDYEYLLKVTGLTSVIRGLFITVEYGIYGYLGIPLENALGTYVFSSTLMGGVIGLGVGIVFGLIFIFGTKWLYKLISRIKNKETIDRYSKEIMDNLEAIEYKIKHQMDSYYNSAKNRMNEIIISQSKPMENIIGNENIFQKFLKLKENYCNYLKKFNEPQGQ